MSLLLLLRFHTAAFFEKFGWAGISILLGVHFAVSYLVIVLAGEEHLVHGVDFLYFYLTTATTVGYGDMSPKTFVGKAFTAVWIMLGGIALLTTMVGLVGNVLLGLQLTRLDRFADALVTDCQRAGIKLGAVHRA